MIRLIFKLLGFTLISGILIVGIYALGVNYNWYGELESAGTLVEDELPRSLVKEKYELQLKVNPETKQILFGDTHVHTTYSTDAFLWSLPILQGEGPHPISDACDYARFCSAIDFWATTDHAESLTPRKWNEIKESVRQCNSTTSPEDPDLVTFLGYEWTQVGSNPDNHYGHKNVIFLETEEDKVPLRPISSGGITQQGMRETLADQAERLKPLAIFDFTNRERYNNFTSFAQELVRTKLCEEGVNSNLLPADCTESADTSKLLFQKLNETNVPTIVIPHGNTWGFYTPPTSSLDKQLEEGYNDENLQVLFEIMSGHGNSEEYRSWRASKVNEDGSLSCPEPTQDYLPSCWRAGEIIYERCTVAGFSEDECKTRELEARNNYVAFGTSGHLTVPGVEVDDWLDSGQCKDCFLPSFNYRPAGSGQYALAIGNFDQNEIKRFRFGFIASSDNHRARPGTGYKEIDRRVTTESNGVVNTEIENLLYPPEEKAARSVLLEGNLIAEMGFAALEVEREASFFTTGGLAAVHSNSRSRDDIWDAFQRRETYGTTGDRILLWFDLLANNATLPMGGEITTKENPTFRVKAVGAFKQKPGCPDYSSTKIKQEDIERICKNECYNPSDERKIITKIEVIKVLPQIYKNESVDPLIMDAWKTFECKADQNGCEVTFSDPNFSVDGRDAAYYVRAIQEPSQVINAKNLRCEYDSEGNCIKVNQCHATYKTDPDDDCLSMSDERAWSSPIFVDYL